MQNAKRLILSLGTALAVTACGGGGGDSSTPAPGGSPIQTTPITISSSNQTTVSQAAVAEAINLGTTASGAGEILVGSVVEQNAIATRKMSLVRQALELVKNAQNTQLSASVIGAVEQITENCPAGGTVTNVITDANNNGIIDSGDSIAVSLNNCKYGSVTENGSITIGLNSIAGDFDAGTGVIVASINYGNYSLAMTGYPTAITHGGITMSASQTGTSTFTATLNLAALRTTIVSGGVTVLDSQQTGTVSVTGSTTTYSASVTITDLTVAGSWSGGLGGQMTLKTETGKPFVIDSSGNLVAGGVLLVTGNNSKLRITILGNTSAQVQLDATNDGIYESTTTVAI